MIKSLSARTRNVLAIAAVLAAFAAGTFAIKGIAPVQAEGDSDSIQYGTTDQLTPEEVELLGSDTPKTAVVDAQTGDIISITPRDAG